MISSCTCGEARPHKIARRRTADDKIVLLWDDGSLTSALGAVIRGSANPRTDEQRAEARLAGWLVLGEVSLYDADEITPLIKTARALVRRDPGAQPGDLRAAMRRQREAAQLPSPTWETCAGFRLGTFPRITGLASLAIWHETDRGTYQVMHVSRTGAIATGNALMPAIAPVRSLRLALEQVRNLAPRSVTKAVTP